MSDWQESALGRVAKIQTGPFGSQLKNDQYITGGTPVVTVEHINNFRVSEFDYPSVNEENKDRLSRYILRAGDIVFTRVGSVDLSAYIQPHQEGWMFSSRMLRVRPNENLDARYLSYFFQQKSFRENLLSIAVGATMPSINTEILEGVSVTYPRLTEQKAIAAVLSSLDDKIDLLHRQNKTLEAMAETLFRQWFVEEAGVAWKTIKISDFVEVLSGFAFKSTTFTESGAFRLITIKAVQDGYLELAGADRINDIPLKMPDYCYLKHGDILLSLTGNVGRCCLVDDEGLLLNQRVAKLRAKNKRDWALVYAMFRQSSMKQYLEEMAKGTAQANLSPIETANMEVSLPPIKALELYSEAATPLLEKVLFNKSQIRTLEIIRDTLLPKLMSGEVRVALDS